MLKTPDLFNLEHTMAKSYLEQFEYPWQALKGIKDLILELGPKLGEDYTEISPTVWVHKTATVAPTASVSGPCIVGANSEVRHCAYIRGSVLVGENCVVGNSTEVKNAILFDNVQIPHFNYAGDSILGYKVHMGGGTMTSNVKSDKSPVTVRNGEERIETGLKKFGAILGDYVEVGANTLLNPGVVVGCNSIIYPMACVRGVVPPESIWKNDGRVVKKEQR